MEKFPELKFGSLFENEETVGKYWQDNDIFQKTLDKNPHDRAFSFYDGPPFITGIPHYGTLLPSIAKDIIPRYQTMKGKYVRRVWGWDCHGLPAENQVEKQLGLKNKKDVEELGIDKFVAACKEYVKVGSEQWRWYIDKIGRFVDMDHAYRTDSLDFMETVIWLFKELYNKDLIYKGKRISLYCPRCATPLSKFEVTMDEGSYKDVEDPAITIAFKLTDDDAYVLAWTTTPWTLPANLALAVNAEADYVKVEVDGKKYILMEKLLDKTFAENPKILDKFKGKDLVGKSYQPLFDFVKSESKNDYKIYDADFVSMDDGTGVVHIAPSFGEDDYNLGIKQQLSQVETLDESGVFNVGTWKGTFYKKANPEITADLKNRDLLLKESTYTHSYPHCHRCNTALIYKLQDAWFMKIEPLRADLIKDNKDINWVPKHFGEGRFKYNLETAPDWTLSRSRYFGSPIPVWQSIEGDRIVVGSIKELEELSGQKITDLHRPFIDEVIIKKNGKTYTRVKEVLDGWFESGAMPFGQYHYPFENKDEFAHGFPTDFIVEYTGQLRGWFYYLDVLSHATLGKNSFKNVVVTGVLMGDDGRKMSKSLGNYPDPKAMIEKYGAEALRLLFMGGKIMVGEDTVTDEAGIREESRLINISWNSYRYFATYANVHDFAPNHTAVDKTALDEWIELRLNDFVSTYSAGLDNFDFATSTRAIRPFIEDLSTWYIRRSRDRFVAGDVAALQTLHDVLLKFAIAVAPTLPFSAEAIYRGLTGKESVHLEDYPAVEKSADNKLIENMELVRAIASAVHMLRAEAGHSLRQKLADITLENLTLDDKLVEILKDEVNVNEIKFAKPAGNYKTAEVGKVKASLNIELTPELKKEGLLREIIRAIQDARKKAGLKVGEKVALKYQASDKDVAEIMANNSKDIAEAATLTEVSEGDADQEILAGKLKIKLG